MYCTSQISCAKLVYFFQTNKYFKKNNQIFAQIKKKSYLCTRKTKKHRGVEQLVARQAHNLEVACSSPASATTSNLKGLLFCLPTTHKKKKAQVVVRLLALFKLE